MASYTGGLGGPRPFAAEELVACDECLRANPPTRMNCLYCGARLPSNERNENRLRPTLRKLEEWEAGYNVVLLPRAGFRLKTEDAIEAADLLRLEPEHLASFFDARVALPLARAASIEDARLIERRLIALGLSVSIVMDEELGAGEPPRRVRAFEFGEYLVARAVADGQSWRLKWTDVSLLVVGRLVSKRVEVEERQARLRARSEFVEARELAADESVLDIYAGDERSGLRVLAGNFDYSCLGERKGLLAGENFQRLIELLRERAQGAEFDDAYTRVRPLLAAAWPPAERTESGGLRRERPGRFNTEAITLVSNETQFTRYSRLRRHLARDGFEREQS
jgi:hypothetical protein